MLKNRIISFIVVLAVIMSFCGSAFASTSLPVQPELKLSVQQLPSLVYPGPTQYTAQLSFVPPYTTTAPKVDFYNIVPGPTPTSPTQLVYLGSALIDNTGKAVFVTTLKPGSYQAISKIVLGTTTIWSNTVAYKF